MLLEIPRLTSHVSELLATALQVIPVFCLYGVLNGTWHRVIRTQNCALHKLDFTRGIALQPSCIGGRTTRLLPLCPCLCRTCLTAAVRRWGAVGSVARIFQSCASVFVVPAIVGRCVSYV